MTTQDKTRTICITGATSGIGRASAYIFAENGYRLLLIARRKERLEQLKDELNKRFNANVDIRCLDVRDYSALKEELADVLEGKTEIDLLLNNAGLALGLKGIDEGELTHWNQMIDTNIKGVLHMTKIAVPGMKKRKKGHIINIASIAGKEVYPNGNVYCATKHAVEALTKAMRIDLLPYNIRVGQVAPGHVEDTEFALVRFEGDRDKAQIYQDFNPVKSSDIAEIIYFMATRPSHVNIQDVLVTGTQQASATILQRNGRIFDVPQ